MAPHHHVPALQFLRRILGLPLTPFPGRPCSLGSTKFNDVVIISIEIESSADIMSLARLDHLKSQVGVSILDLSFVSLFSTEDALRTYNFATGSNEADKNFANLRFLFGETHHMKFLEIIQSLNKIIRQYRNVVLVGNGLSESIRVFRHLGLKMRAKRSSATLFDTKSLALHVLGSPTVTCRSPLEVLLQKFQCPLANLCIGGHKANSNLRVVLSLLVESYQGYDEFLDEATTMKLLKMKAIAQFPLPGPLSPPKYQQFVFMETVPRIYIAVPKSRLLGAEGSKEEPERICAQCAARAKLPWVYRLYAEQKYRLGIGSMPK